MSSTVWVSTYSCHIYGLCKVIAVKYSPPSRICVSPSADPNRQSPRADFMDGMNMMNPAPSLSASAQPWGRRSDVGSKVLHLSVLIKVYSLL